MYQVNTDHQVVGFGPDLMSLFNCPDGAVIVTAERPAGIGGVWNIHAEGVADVTATTRGEAITAMINQVLAMPGAAGGYSTLVPHGLADMP